MIFRPVEPDKDACPAARTGSLGGVEFRDPGVIERLLTTPATWAVVGLSNNRSRAAYGVARFLQSRLGMTIVPVHPKAETVHGATGYTSLADVPDGTRVDVVDCFVNRSIVGGVIDEAIAESERLGIGAIWMQLDVIDTAAAERARAAGLDVVMDACPAIEAPKLGL